MTVTIASVATSQDVANELGGQAALDNLTSESFTIKHVLDLTLADVLDSLVNRTPPVRDSDIQDPTQLKKSVVFGACARLYRNNITTGEGDVSSAKHKIYQRQYESILSSLRPTVGGVVAASSWSIPMHRR